MKRQTNVPAIGLLLLATAFICLNVGPALASSRMQTQDTDEFGPVVRAYLGYLRNEQEVVDDRASRHEVSANYYRRNSNRIRALRQMALKIAKETHNDYLPELEAITRDEFGLLFEQPPRPQEMMVGEVLRGTFRFLGVVRSAESFYLFARLDPYEQAELSAGQKTVGTKVSIPSTSSSINTSSNSQRAKRASVP